ncbi:hypothetical protein JAAARDRAFT_40100 [Jaapia argillacea MUCL 33604]|uniref:AAA+ ATPase domain-containing protein n=1 Tax=Jaapia argillacea MUCL 33604 TaxID=933084 RepID=A0A067PMG6_9AGAM|nr:hypothetical protein JAAARDRAFT_40100 [Jaapia argillacea MUCL 33604]
MMGFSSLFAAIFSPRPFDSLKLVLLGILVESGRRFFYWLVERFKYRPSINAYFNQGDPAYEWIVHFMTQEEAWKRSRDFNISAKSSQRTWGINMQSGSQVQGNAEYVPIYCTEPYLFRWKGYWFEIKKNRDSISAPRYPAVDFGGPPLTGTIHLSIFTLKVSILSDFVEEIRARYVESNKPRVVIRSGTESTRFGGPNSWSNIKAKYRRPLDTLVLGEGVVESLLADAQEFMDTVNWYVEAGIPHRRGYLLHGPPGTGKTSTIHALAGELGLEVYTLSLASGHMDDGGLQQATSRVPPNTILLIEDIDCAFPSREEEEDDIPSPFGISSPYMSPPGLGSRVTLSGLLNVIDGIGSEEGRIFFATTNHVDRLDPALIRPGRIDMKIEYTLATHAQSRAMFSRFFPESRFPNTDADKDPITPPVSELAKEFADSIPEKEFSIAELQGYLLGYKSTPAKAVANIRAWVQQECSNREAKKKREAEKAEKRKKAKEQATFDMHNRAGEAMAAGFGTVMQRSIGDQAIKSYPSPAPTSGSETPVLVSVPQTPEKGSPLMTSNDTDKRED